MSEGTSPQVGPATAGPGSPWAPPRGPEQPPTGGLPPSGSTGVLPPYPPQPQPTYMPPPPAAPPRERTPKSVWVLSGGAVALAVAAVVMGALAWTRPDPAPITTTVTPSAPTYSAQEVDAARDEACAAAKSVVAAVYEASVPLVAALPNRDSPEYKAALANEQSVVLVEMEYLRLHTPPATPRDIADPMNDYIDATLGVLAADTSGQDRNLPAQQGQTAMDKVHAACQK
ncbi:hypothetical protein MARA_03230 (plasmid) [Mycolicibacterium arabiense]|uniref:Alanine and proline rich membrane protein n=1 Tax=Mycolicibacterium arabiense TaxID=1286181 RepID=A0A7I7RQU5_9MYCO|nr:hypothetical protein MARA_03230 [Mycolicibacterium arabiense]